MKTHKNGRNAAVSAEDGVWHLSAEPANRTLRNSRKSAIQRDELTAVRRSRPAQLQVSVNHTCSGNFRRLSAVYCHHNCHYFSHFLNYYYSVSLVSGEIIRWQT